MPVEFLEIDGSIGEGGGQVLRTALALSILRQQPIVIYNIRAGRKNPGLQEQHLQAVNAAAAICQAQVDGAERHSQRLTFRPGAARGGEYTFRIATAGSATLVLQTALLPLTRAGQRSRLTITGGTHVPWSPPFEFIQEHWLAFLARMGIQAQATLLRCGFYPQGGGQIQAVIQPSAEILPLNLNGRGELRAISGVSAVGNLSLEIATRQKHQALRRLEPRFPQTKIKAQAVNAFGKGTYLFLKAQFEHGAGCSSALGAIGKRAEQVADEAVDELLAYINSGANLDAHLADQLLLPCALAEAPSCFTTSQVTLHLLTNAQVIQLFGAAEVEIQGELGQPGVVRVKPRP